MSFAEKLAELNLHTLMINNRFFKIKPRNYECLEKVVRLILLKSLKVYIDEDCDPDGYFTGLIVKSMFDKLGHKDYEIAKHFTKRHVLTVEYARTLIDRGYDVVFLLDSSTNSLDVIELLTSHEIIVVVLDHHDTKLGWRAYPAGSYLINPRMEVHEPVLAYPELCSVIKEWAEKKYAICIKEYKYMIPSISRDSLLAIFRDLNYRNFKIDTEIDERCDAVLLLDDRDPFRTAYKDVVILDSGGDFKAHGARVLQPISEINSTAALYGELSCGALTALVCDYTLTKLGIKDNTDLYVHGYITLYSDVCNLNNAYNVAYIRHFRDDKLNLSSTVRLFMSEYDYLNRSFVSYNMIPRINALVRTEHFELLDQLFYNTPDDPTLRVALKSSIDTIYLKSREYAKELAALCVVDDSHSQVVIGIMPENAPSDAKNYTGLIASQIAERTNAFTLCLYKSAPNQYSGSGRDPFNRDARSMLDILCYAQGHGAAFGVKIPMNQLDMIGTFVETYFEEGRQDIILVNWDEEMPLDKVKSDIQVMSEYNEYGGQGLPAAYALFKITPSCRISPEKKRTLVFWRGFKLVVFSTVLQVGDVLAVSPSCKGPGVELLVKNIGYM